VVVGLGLVRQHGFFEYFNPQTGKFSWTAALLLDVLYGWTE